MDLRKKAYIVMMNQSHLSMIQNLMNFSNWHNFLIMMIKHILIIKGINKIFNKYQKSRIYQINNLIA